MKINDLKKLTSAKLKERLASVQKELIDLTFDVKTGEEKDYTVLKKKRKEIARIVTLINSGHEVIETVKISEDVKEEKKSKKKIDADKEKKNSVENVDNKKEEKNAKTKVKKGTKSEKK